MGSKEITQLIQAMNSGDRVAEDQLFHTVYDELRIMARTRMSRERKEHTLQPTALVHEVWMRLVGSSSHEWKDRRHFFAAAAEAMRRLLVDSARRRKCEKRGGQNAVRLHVDCDQFAVKSAIEEDIIDLDDALAQLAEKEPEKAQVVKLKFLLSMTNLEVANVLGVSEATVERYWAYSRAWLHSRMKTRSAKL